MKNIPLLVLLVTLSVLTGMAQDSIRAKKPTIGLHFFYNDFKTAQLINSGSLKNVLKNKLWNKPQNMEGGFGVDYLQGLNKNTDLIGTVNASWIDYLLPGNTYFGSSNFLLDISAGVHLKMVTDRHVVVPFLIAKGDYTSYKNIKGFSLAPGAGLQFNLFNDAFVLTTIEYRSAISSTISNELYYSIGIATPIGKRKAKPAKVIEKPPVPVVKEVILPAKDVIISVLDEATGQPLPYVAVAITSPGGRQMNGSTDEYGRVVFNSLAPEAYTITGLLNTIKTTPSVLSKENFVTNDNQILVTLTHNDPRFTLSGIVVNKTRNTPEGGADVNVTNETAGIFSTIRSNDGDGVFRTQLATSSDFTLVGKKANYISNIERITTRGLNRSTTLYVKLELGMEEAKIGQSIDLKNIYFESGKASLNTSVSSDLDKLIRFLKDNPEAKLEIQGHTDNSGSLALNNRLSQSRANSVVEYLTGNGIEKERLTAKGYGPSMPVSDNISPEGRAKNRRVVMKVIK